MKKLLVLILIFLIPTVNAFTVENPPNDFEDPDSTWFTESNAYASDDLYAYSSTDQGQVVYKNYSLNISEDMAITKVEVISEGHQTDAWSARVYVSWDAGATWCQLTPTILGKTTDSNYTSDATSCTDWTPEKLNDTNYQVLYMALQPGGCLARGSEVGVKDDTKREGFKLVKVEDLRVGDKVIGWNESQGFVWATVTNVTPYPRTTIYRLISEYPEEYDWLCDYYKRSGYYSPALYSEYDRLGLNKSKCYKDLAVTWNHLLYSPYERKNKLAKDFKVGDYLTGLYFTKDWRMTKHVNKIVMIEKYEDESIHIETDSDYFFSHYMLAIIVKTIYLDLSVTRVTYQDAEPPRYFDNSTNSTNAGEPVEFRLRWTDNIGLSGFVFSWFNGSNWTQSTGSSDLESGEIQFRATDYNSTLISDGFEKDLSKWVADTGWERKSFAHTGSWSAGLYSNSGSTALIGNLTSLPRDASDASKIYIDFWIYDDDLDAGDFVLYYNDSSGNWDYIQDLSGFTEDTWNHIVKTTTDSQYFHPGFSIRFYCRARGANAAEKCLVDDVSVIKTVNETEADRTYNTYDDINIDTLDVIKNITVTINVSAYINSGSAANSNSNPDLWLEIYNGTDWIEIGNMSVVGTGNVSKTTQDSTILSAWQSKANRDIRIKGRYLDYSNENNVDEINYTDVWVEAYSTGEFKNDTWTAFSPGCETECWSNVTKVVNNTVGTTIKWRVYANDTTDNWNASEIYSFVTTTADNPPDFVESSNSTNTTVAGQPCNFTLNWTDDVGLSGYIFSTNNSGTWQNASWVSFSGTENVSWNVTTLNNTVGALVQWCYYANDTSDNWNGSSCDDPFNLTTTSAVQEYNCPGYKDESTCQESPHCKWCSISNECILTTQECGPGGRPHYGPLIILPNITVPEPIEKEIEEPTVMPWIVFGLMGYSYHDRQKRKKNIQKLKKEIEKNKMNKPKLEKLKKQLKEQKNRYEFATLVLVLSAIILGWFVRSWIII